MGSNSAGTIHLPLGTSPTLRLEHPTVKELRTITYQNGTSWRGALSLSDYVKREEVLASQKLTRDGGMTFWVLVDTEERSADNGRTILASCETYRKKALVLHRDGQVQNVLCYGIGSVWCSPELRGHGYASRMLKEVGRMLPTWQTTASLPCQFSVLYSDIGKKFYAAHGWEPFRSSHIVIYTSNDALASKQLRLPPSKALKAADLAPLCAEDEAFLRAFLAKQASISKAEPRAKAVVAHIPDIETIEWHHAREDFVGHVLRGEIPEVKGAIVQSANNSRVWCYWTRMWYSTDPNDNKENTLHILRLVIEDHDTDPRQSDQENANGQHEETAADGANAKDSDTLQRSIAALLLHAWREAKKWNMADVQIWNPSIDVVNAVTNFLDPDAKVVDRDMESIACLKWYGKADEADANQSALESVEWVGNEKYGWC